MIRTTRREALMAALAVPAAGALPQWRGDGRAVLLHDPSLGSARRLADAARARGDQVLAIKGDRIRFARAVFERHPALVVGVSRHADALLIEEVGREVGYLPVPQSLDARFGWALARSGRLPQP